jgi:hypothetical protein
MEQDRKQGETKASLDRHYHQATAMVFGPILALVAYAGLLLVAVTMSPPELRAWTIGAGIAIAIVACFVYLFWAIAAARRRE